MISKVLKYVIDNKMITPKDVIIVGVSGGADSICLLFVLLELQRTISFSIVVVHIEHGIRGQESIEDALFVERICREHGIQFIQYSHKVLQLTKETHSSVEEVGRKVRYDSFHMVCEQYNGNKIAVAHHQDDQAETILWNLFRGSGMKGLGGIKPVQGKIIRPLLCVERDEIEAFLSSRNIGYREDATNYETDYTRNKIRLQLIPYVEKELNSQAVRHIVTAGEAARESEDFISKYADARCELMVRGNRAIGLTIMLSEFLEEAIVIQKYIIRNCLEILTSTRKDITWVHVEDIVKLCTMQVGKQIHLPGSVKAIKRYDALYIYRDNQTDSTEEDISNENSKEEEYLFNIVHSGEEIEVSSPGIYRIGNGVIEFTRNSNKNQKIPQKKYTKWFDYDKIKGNLKIRVCNPGDFIVINNAGGRKMIKSYFVDQKIERQLRNRIPLLMIDNEVIWIVGYRISEAYKVTEQTKTILEVQITEEK